MKVRQFYLYGDRTTIDANVRAYAKTFEKTAARIHQVTAYLTADPAGETISGVVALSDAAGTINQLGEESEITDRTGISWSSPVGMPVTPSMRLAFDCKAATAAVTANVVFHVIVSEG